MGRMKLMGSWVLLQFAMYCCQATCNKLSGTAWQGPAPCPAVLECPPGGATAMDGCWWKAHTGQGCPLATHCSRLGIALYRCLHCAIASTCWAASLQKVGQWKVHSSTMHAGRLHQDS